MTARIAVILLACVMLASCSTPVQLQPVNIAVPVQCQQLVPARPVMPTELLPVDADLDAFAKAALAELERREGYEVRLRTALVECTRPLAEPGY